MTQDQYNARYDRQLKLPGFGLEAQQRLGNAKVLVVGAGGLAVPALQYLCGMGIGAIGIVDDDVVSLSNLHRQVLYHTSDVGRPKVQVAQERLRALNPDVAVAAYQTKLNEANALEIIGAYDFVLDATDNFSARYLINDACVILGKPFVYGAVHGFEGHVSVFNYNGGPTYRCLYPKMPSLNEIPDCNDSGVLGLVPAMIGCRQALEIIKLVAGIGRSLSGYLQVYDFLNDTQRRVKLKVCSSNLQIAALQESYSLSCPGSTVPADLLAPELEEWYRSGNPFTVFDVREPLDFAQGHLPQAHNLPLSAINGDAHSINIEGPVVLCCQKGIRSLQAAAMLRRQHPEIVFYSLSGGIESWQKDVAS